MTRNKPGIKKQKISIEEMSRRANKFANEMVESFEALLDKQMYNWEYKVLHDRLFKRAMALLHSRFQIVQKNKETK